MIAASRALAALAAGALLVTAACKGEEPEPEPEPQPEPEIDLLEAVGEALSSVNGALPAELAETINFEAKELEDGDMAGPIPEGWETGAIPWNYRPPDGADLGFHTQFGLGFACAGRCQPKAWQDEIAEHEFAQFVASDAFEIVRDERVRGASGRLVVAKRNETVYLLVAWWNEGASRYAFCRATLDGRAAEAADAFEQACRAARFTL